MDFISLIKIESDKRHIEACEMNTDRNENSSFRKRQKYIVLSRT